jgi:aminoglycoside phosphotransferase
MSDRPMTADLRSWLRIVALVALLLNDGRSVLLGDLTPGGSKNETRFAELSDGQQIVVKIQRSHGRLDVEERALIFLASSHVPAPTVVGAGLTEVGHRFLVITREQGARTNAPDGWGRLGRDLASLTEVSIDSCPLERVSLAAFIEDHQKRLSVVADVIDGSLVAEIAAAIERVEASDRAVLTHGDPGSGNYLDTGRTGIIIDWETAFVGPFGLDAGRAAFIALMDLGRSGRPAALWAALIDGYRNALDDPAELSDELLTAWTIVAGLQFIHGRFVQPLRTDRTPQTAADTLNQFLSGVR